MGGTLADNILENELGAWNEEALQKYSLYNGLSSANIIKVMTGNEDSGKHITQKPLKLMELLVELVTIQGQIVLDSFAGSGTVCVAAKNLNRQYIGIEADHAYVDITNQ